MNKLLGILSLCLFAIPSHSAVDPNSHINAGKKLTFTPIDESPYFDIPVTYNAEVKKWIKHFQGPGRKWYSIWLKRSHRYLPLMQKALADKGLPQDLAYVAMIESGFSAKAVSSANAVGYWQFIAATGKRYGLKKDWWIDERKDFYKSTIAASNYLADLYKMFNSWYLSASAYNMGENRVKRLIKKYKTKNFWVLSRKKDFPNETKNYIPKLIAALMIAKMPDIYGFKVDQKLKPYEYEQFYAPGGTDLVNLAKHLKISKKTLLKINPALLNGFIPKTEKGYWIRIPKGTLVKVSQYMEGQLKVAKDDSIKRPQAQSPALQKAPAQAVSNN
ncbi:MAG: lytic transglycosylase domain-containing protein [Bdellovibrionales bacterium]|nr:lytic transglycosylase domain-containing protein [Bdellovibrionales bacterium]